jgi:tryptophanyl-tRNA synthetase
MSLDDPGVKMSKSGVAASYVALDEARDEVIKKFKRAVTDSGSAVEAAEDKPAITNLLEIYSGFSGSDIAQIESDYVGVGYGQFKQDLGELVADKLGQLQEKFTQIRHDDNRLAAIIEAGNAKAAVIANQKLAQVKQKLGLL